MGVLFCSILLFLFPLFVDLFHFVCFDERIFVGVLFVVICCFCLFCFYFVVFVVGVLFVEYLLNLLKHHA